MKRIAMAALAALTLGTGLGAAQAQGFVAQGFRPEGGRPGVVQTQYYRDEYGPDRRRDYEYDRPRRRDYDDERFDRRREYDRRGDFGPRRGASVCVTARGNCPTRPAPYNSPCGCEIPGFGYKRGAVGG